MNFANAVKRTRPQSISEMVHMAIANAHFHGIMLHHGGPNSANGDCAFEAVADNISKRPCFSEIYNKGAQINRREWLSETQSLVFEFSGGAGMAKDEFNKEWNKLKEPRNYEYQLGDYILHAIAHCTQKDILIFNTKPEGSFDPIYVIEASKLAGRPANSEIPVLLAYNDVHFESLFPNTEADEIKTVELKKAFITNAYTYKKSDIPAFIQSSTKTGISLEIVSETLRCTEPAKKKIKDMTKDEKREYKRSMKQIRRQSMTALDKENMLEKDRKRKQDERQKKRAEDEVMFRKVQAKEKATQRGKKRNLDEIAFKEDITREKSLQRKSKRNIDAIAFKQGLAKEKALQRKTKRNIDLSAFKKGRAREKALERESKRNIDEIGFKKGRAREKALESESKKNMDESTFKQVQASKKARVRAKKKITNEIAFKKGIAKEKASQRSKKKNIDESGYKKTMVEEKRKYRLKKVNSAEKRRRLFLSSVEKGRIFECVVCHRKCFQNGVFPLPPDFETDIDDNYPKVYRDAIGKIKTRKVDGFLYWCCTCKTYLSRGKIPPMSNQNGLDVFDLSNYEELNLTELENTLIALNIVFQKVILLPKSRWPALKDRTVNIPIYESDVLNTIKSLPRTPAEAGIIAVNLKRKLNYKQSHKTQYVSVPKVISALKTLKNLGNKYYNFVPNLNEFRQKCKETDIDGFNLIFSDEEETSDLMPSSDPLISQEITSPLSEENHNSSQDEAEEEELEYQQKDPVKRWQFDYNRSTCFNDEYPEIGYKDDLAQSISVAPGEGKVPSNILQETDWDIKSFPCLFPDGKNSLHSERNVKLKEQDFFIQRIMNKDSRFSQNTAFVFAGTSYLESKQIERNKGISFIRGKSSAQGDGTFVFSLEDPCSVLDNIKNTPKYWQKAKYELIARLENLGPFSFFFTLSCADMRWPENFTALLQDQTISCEYKNGLYEVLVNGISLESFLQANASKHEFIRKNLLNATLTFNQRVKMFFKHILMSKGNPMAIKHYSYKVEFALRGAGHIHGVLWVDWENCQALPKTDIENVKTALKKIRNEEEIGKEELKSISKFADKFVSCSLKNPRVEDIVKSVNRHNHTKTCRKYSNKSCRFHFPRFPSLKTLVSVPVRLLKLTEQEKKALLKEKDDILNKVKAVLEDESIMEDIGKLHHEQVENYKCILKKIQIIDIVLDENSEVKETGMIKIESKILQEQIIGEGYSLKKNTIKKSILLEFYKSLKAELKGIDIHKFAKARLLEVLKRAEVVGDSDEAILKKYHKLLALSEIGYRVVLKRDIDEIHINNYNPEWILNWDANMDIQLCLDFFAIITYISDYYTKDDSGTMKHIKEALNSAGNESLRFKLNIVAQQFLTHRQIGESEAYFRILPHLHMKESNIESVFVQTGFYKNRSRFLHKLSDEEIKYCENPIEVSGRMGLYTEKPSVLEKYMRRDFTEHPDVFDITYIQFAKRYTATRNGPKNKDLFKPKDFVRGLDEAESLSDLDFIVTHDFGTKNCLKILPRYIKLHSVKFGEPEFMKLNKIHVARLHKFNQEKNPHEFYFSELQLYLPFTSEDMLYPDCLEKCKSLYDEKSDHNGQRKISNTKKILMEHLEIVEEGTEKAREVVDSSAGLLLDPENEQDDAECQLNEKYEQHPDFIIKDPDDLQCHQSEYMSSSMFKKIELYSDEKIKELTLNLDKEQRTVLDIGVSFARNIVKARNGGIASPTAPLLIVQGGAGTGKSTVIDAVSQQMEKILRTAGDNPFHPYIIKCAFTGTAAANIMGQTMHSAFSFNFGNEFLSLGDKSRDEKRKQLENLQIVIIDEYSMIKANMLYQLDLRLKELKQRQDLPFGGVGIFLFGDILQLRPVMARYIFEEPQNEAFALSYLIDPLWKKFEIVMLVTNHRQGEDKEYADILNRIRRGEVNDDDLTKLEERVLPVNHPDIPSDALVISCKNAAVNGINEKKLKLINDDEFKIEAVTRTKTQGNIKPVIDNSGAVRNTPLQQILKLRIGARVMLTYNIDTCDSLTNGTFGEVKGFEIDHKNCVSSVFVHFDNEISGKERRKNFVNLQKIYQPFPVTPIDKIEFQYSLSRKQSASSANASAIQFPLKLAFAATSHKIQGSTIKKPKMLVLDLRTVIEAAQAYVMLSRVQALSQLVILESLPSHKIYASSDALNELGRMELQAMNQKKCWNIAVSCNIRSISHNFQGFITTPNVLDSEVLCLQETWLSKNQKSGFEIEGFQSHYNGISRGKGIVTYFRDPYSFGVDVVKESYQMTQVYSDSRNIVNVYRQGLIS